MYLLPVVSLAIKDLNEIASEDPFFEVRFQNEEKNIDDCITYILNQVQKSGCNGFEDSEIFNMAYHYYVTVIEKN